jgi:hypothetical protein
MFNFTVTRTSDAIAAINCQLMSGFVLVSFKNGTVYAYKNVSKRAIINLYMNQNMSLGFWVNENCVQSNRVKYANVSSFIEFYSEIDCFASC